VTPRVRYPDLADLHAAGLPLPKVGRLRDEADRLRDGTASSDPRTDTVLLNPDFWLSGLLNNAEGNPKRCLANVMHVLSQHPEWGGVLAWDAFGLAVVTRKRPPMRDQDAPTYYENGDWTDEDSARTAAWIAAEVGFEPTTKMVDDAVNTIAHRTIVHPVRDWLSSLKWDGTPRLDGFAATYLGAPDSKYAAAVGRRWMIAAVARVFEPGSKVDSLLGLEGNQGIGKSSALRLLAGAEWFADSGLDIGSKDSYQSLRRKWVFEIPELASFKGRDIEKIKSFLSSQVDTYRASYGRRTQDHPRQVVFAGSTNEQHYLADPTGSRRFWPVRCRTIDLEGIKRDRSQLWAEAVAAYRNNEPWHLDTPELRALAVAEQAEREEQDDWVEIVSRWLESPTRPSGKAERELVDIAKGLTTADVLLGALSFAPERITPGATKRVGHVLRALGFFPRQLREAGERTRRYFRTSDCDGVGDTETASEKPLSPVTGTYTDPCTQRERQGGSSTGLGKVPVPAVTRDAYEADERAAIQAEGGE
jgi:putative DNA primase/helicase